MNTITVEDKDQALHTKLSRIHRRVFPLSLFPTPESFLPKELFNGQNSFDSPTSSPKKKTHIKSPLIVTPKHKTTEKQNSPSNAKEPYDPNISPQFSNKNLQNLEYRTHKDQHDYNYTRGSQNQYFYLPQKIKISPRSKATVHSINPIFTTNPHMSIPYPLINTFDEFSRNISKKKKHRKFLSTSYGLRLPTFDNVAINEKLHNKRYGFKNRRKSMYDVHGEDQRTKISRITSSKIPFPATNVGQIMMRIRDLVIDPLKRELVGFNTT